MVMGRSRSLVDCGSVAKGEPFTRRCSCGRVWPRSPGLTGPRTRGGVVVIYNRLQLRYQ